MKSSFDDFRALSDCQRVEHILQYGIDATSENLLAYWLWDAKSHASTCQSCQQDNPLVIETLTSMVNRAETLLALEIDAIRAKHMTEAGELVRRVILSRPADSAFPLDDALLNRRSAFEERNAEDEAVGLALLSTLAQAGRGVKRIFETVFGEGITSFQVVPDLNDGDQIGAREACVGLVQKLSEESRAFAFSAALAAEVLTEGRADLGVLYKVILAAAPGYVEDYFQSFADQARDSSDVRVPREDAAVLRRTQEYGAENEADKIDSVYAAQTRMMDVQSELLGRMKRLEDLRESRGASKEDSDALNAECEAALRNALRSRFDELQQKTRDFMLGSERLYTRPRDDADFTSVVAWLTKAFEFEFRRRVVEPLISDLGPLALDDSTFRGNLSTFTLGQYLALFKKYKLKTEPMFERLGLKHEKICTAIERVNREKDVKHLGTKNKSEATEFRGAFLDSVLNSLFPLS
jgi:hypothetical protein